MFVDKKAIDPAGRSQNVTWRGEEGLGLVLHRARVSTVTKEVKWTNQSLGLTFGIDSYSQKVIVKRPYSHKLHGFELVRIGGTPVTSDNFVTLLHQLKNSSSSAPLSASPPQQQQQHSLLQSRTYRQQHSSDAPTVCNSFMMERNSDSDELIIEFQAPPPVVCVAQVGTFLQRFGIDASYKLTEINQKPVQYCSLEEIGQLIKAYSNNCQLRFQQCQEAMDLHKPEQKQETEKKLAVAGTFGAAMACVAVALG